jgi:hypothetical protein
MTAVSLQGDGDGIFDCQDCGLFTYGDVHAAGALLVCHNARCSSCTHRSTTALATPSLRMRHTCEPHCEGAALPRTACTTLLLHRPLTPLQRLACRLDIR